VRRALQQKPLVELMARIKGEGTTELRAKGIVAMAFTRPADGCEFAGA